VFTVKGFGTVATGTLVSGSVAKEQEVEVYPAGRRLRVRGVQVHGTSADRAVAGQRTAVNLADIEPSELARGDALSEPGVFRAVQQVDCRLQLLPTAKPLKHRAPVHFHCGTAEIEAQVRLLEGMAPLQPGGAAYVRLVLRDAALLLPGDRFIIRMFSPVVTIGGGVVVDMAVGAAGKAASARLEVLAFADAAERIALLVRETPFGMGIAGLVARTGLMEPEIAAAAARAPLVPIPQPQPWYVDRAWFQAARGRMVQTVREFHRQNPLQPGIPRPDLRPAGAPPFVLDALLAAAAGEIVAEGDMVRLRGHTLVLNEDEQLARAAIEGAFQQAGLAAPAVAQVLAKSGVEPARARSLLQILLREKRLVRIHDDLVVHHSAIEELRRMLAARKPARFHVGTFKEWTGVSRKYAIPLLEFLDRERITRREGEERLIL
jgi:selenocysteine-specific elongation factor